MARTGRKGDKERILEQWVEVRIRDGGTVTEMFPENARLAELAGKMGSDPEFLYRRFNFPDGIPSEYDWTHGRERVGAYGGAGVQRIKWSKWLMMSARENEDPSGHVGPAARLQVARLAHRGGCECEVCKGEPEK